MVPEGWAKAVVLGSELSGTCYDIAIVGGGVNGCGIARDAAGRGLRVFLCEQNDLASGTSSASTKLIHGGLRYLEYCEFRLVNEALREREVLWSIAPHIVQPLRFVLPHQRGLRPAWMLRLGLLIYDRLGGRKRLPPTRTLDLSRDDAGVPLRRGSFSKAFEYSDCRVDDARLVVLNARDAADRGATIAVGARLAVAEQGMDAWLLRIEHADGRAPLTITAKCLINATGPWAPRVLADALGIPSQPKVRLVQGSHIVVRKLFNHERGYVFQNADGRILFALPYERDFTLIGTTDQDFSGDPADAAATQQEILYVCAAASEYFARPITADEIVWTYAGVRLLLDDGGGAAHSAPRDYALSMDSRSGLAPLLTVYGGKLTTYRRVSERVLAMLQTHLPALRNKAGWTAQSPLPGGDFPIDGFDDCVNRLRLKRSWLSPALADRLVRAYGTRAEWIVEGAARMSDLGAVFGADLTAREVDYLMSQEWARTSADILWRRSKLGLRFSSAEVAALEDYVGQRANGGAAMGLGDRQTSEFPASSAQPV